MHKFLFGKSIVEKIGYKKPLIPTGLKLIITFLFITGTGIILWQYIGTGTLQSRRKIFNLDLFRKSAVKQDRIQTESRRKRTEQPDSSQEKADEEGE